MWQNGRFVDVNSIYSPHYIQRPVFHNNYSNSLNWRPSISFPQANPTTNNIPDLTIDPFVQQLFESIEDPQQKAWRIDTAQWDEVTQFPTTTSSPSSYPFDPISQQLEVEQFGRGVRRYSQIFYPTPNGMTSFNLPPTPNHTNQVEKQAINFDFLSQPKIPLNLLTSNTTSNTTTTTTIRNPNPTSLPYETKALVKVDSFGNPTQFSSLSPQGSPSNSPKRQRRDAMIPEGSLIPRQLNLNEDSSPPSQTTSEEESSQPQKKRKGRFVWSSELHESFEVAMSALGDYATAKNVMAMMAAKGADVSGLTRIRVANHMQYWLSRRNKQIVNDMKSEGAQ